MNVESPQRRNDMGLWKVWSLLCLGASSQMGLNPIAGSQLHVLLYLANTLSPLFGVSPIRGRVLKRGKYPFYPDVQREIDRLAFSGVLKIEKVEYGSRGHLAAHYGLGDKGDSITKKLIQFDPELQKTARLFRELVYASFGKFLGTHIDIGPIDANFGDDAILNGEVVDFSEWKNSNKNMAVARYLLDQLRSLQPNSERDGVRLYCDYLDEALSPA